MKNPIEGLITDADVTQLAEVECLSLDNRDRIEILKAYNSIDVQACPGSGKTTLIAAKLMLLAKKWPCSDRGICVLSHTNVAKNEIIDRLKKSKINEATNLLSYPHFIGTIQDFVGKFVGLPKIRSDGTKINQVDTEVCINLIRAKLGYKTREYINKKSQHKNVLYDFDLKYANGDYTVNVPTFPNGSDSVSYKNLLSVRKSLISDGYFFYRDIYTFARIALFNNTALIESLQRRFPCVFIDEMQDTQHFQDVLLQIIFPLNNFSVCVHRFGDPDQAIFDGIGNEEPNKSFNEKSVIKMDFVIDKSHRFTDEIANKILGLSYNGINLKSELSEDFLLERKKLHSEGKEFQNIIFTYNENISMVIPKFLDIVSQQFSPSYIHSSNFTVKIIGAVGNEVSGANDLKIGSYWSDYKKNLSSRNFKEKVLIEAVRHLRNLGDSDWNENYIFLTRLIRNILYSADKSLMDGMHLDTVSLRKYMNEMNLWHDYCKLLYFWLNPVNELNDENWKSSICKLMNILGFDNVPVNLEEYLSYTKPQISASVNKISESQSSSNLSSLPNNVIQHDSGYNAVLSTIHGVKGETHDATLVLETKYYEYDLKAIVPFLTREILNGSSSIIEVSDRKKKFMRQFYVGMSRPKHLLGIATHATHIQSEQKNTLENFGWKIIDLG